MAVAIASSVFPAGMGLVLLTYSTEVECAVFNEQVTGGDHLNS